MEDKKASPYAKTAPTETIPENTGKGKLLYEIGMGLVGEIPAIGIAIGITYYISERCPCHGDGCMGWALLYLFVVLPVSFSLLAIPLVGECVRFGGMRSGGHKRRRGCYIGIAIGLLLILLSYALGGFYVPWASPIILLAGAIFGYRSDAS